MLALHPWPDFSPYCEAVSCLIWHDERTLLLCRVPGSYCPQTWGCPTGKIESNEPRIAAMQREIAEETGIHVAADRLAFHETLYVRHPQMDFVYHLYSLRLDHPAPVRLNPAEHSAFCWSTFEEALQLQLVPDMAEVLERFRVFHFVKGNQ